MWGQNDAINQPLQPSVMRIYSSHPSDVSVSVTIFGTVSGYPDQETIITNAGDGTMPVNGSKSFSQIERVVKSVTTLGRISVTDTATNLLAVMPTGDTTAGIMYAKVQVYPLPNKAFPVYVWYYKDPYRLVNDNDVHEMGQDFDEAIILLATSKIKAESNLTEGDKFYLLFQDELRSLKKTNLDKMDFFPKLRRPNQTTNSDAFVTPGLLYRQAGGMFGPSSRG
jgi:hypothetical protein